MVDPTVTSLEPWLVRGIIPQLALFQNCNLPRIYVYYYIYIYIIIFSVYIERERERETAAWHSMIIYSHCLEPMCCTLPGFTHIGNLRNCWGLVMQAVRRTEPQVKMNKNRCNGRLSEDDSTVIASLELGYQVKFCRVKQCGFIWPLRFSGVRVFLWHDVALWIKTVVCVCVFPLFCYFLVLGA